MPVNYYRVAILLSSILNCPLLNPDQVQSILAEFVLSGTFTSVALVLRPVTRCPQGSREDCTAWLQRAQQGL